jgi:hypothetical protein
MQKVTPYKQEVKIILNAINFYKSEGDLEKVKELKQELTELKRSRHAR